MIENLEKQIKEINKRLLEPLGRECEVYTRIVGYYRAVNAWNKGKREEYDHRATFTAPEAVREVTPC